MENSRDRDAKVLGFFGIVKSAMRIFVNPKFIAFTMIICCPLCSILSTRNLQQPTNLITEDWSTEVLKARFINNLALFFIAVTTVSSASKIYTGSCAYRSMDLRHFIQNFMTCFCLPIVSSTVAEAYYYLFQATIPKWSSFPVTFVLLASLAKWCEFRAFMRLSFVVSMLEHKRGPFEAYSTSSNLSRGNKERGLALIFVWFFFNCGLQCLFGLVKGGSVITQDSIRIILEYGFKEVTFWLLCTLYYHDCKNRQRQVKKNQKKKRLIPHRLG